MTALALVVPMAGRGSRFSRQGYLVPKPLVALHGKPFFVWAVQSITSKVDVRELIVVVLREHVAQFGIDAIVTSHFPAARVVVIDEVTSGAAETAAVGIAALQTDGPFAVNDCDHAFDASGVEALLPALDGGRMAAALLCFRSASPAFSYVRLDASGHVVGTVEKQAVSPLAIAGCYVFGGKAAFNESFAHYRTRCTYDELFMSGVFNELIESGAYVGTHELLQHIPFGTPEEMSSVDAIELTASTRAPESK